MLNAFFVVWRESLEALLIVGILYAWIKANDPGDKGIRALFAGVAAGVGLALVLGWGLLNAQDELTGEALEIFQIAALGVAALLITQMVIWMSLHGRKIKDQLKQQLTQAHEKRGYWGIATVAALAVAREGAETVIFLYSLAQSGNLEALATGAIGGFAAAILTAWVAAKSLGRLNIGLLLKFSSILLLVLASSLLVAATDRLIGQDWLPALVDPLWDSSALIDDNGNIGRLFADFAGYRARPALSTLLVWAGYWLLALLPIVWINLRGRQPPVGSS